MSSENGYTYEIVDDKYTRNIIEKCIAEDKTSARIRILPGESIMNDSYWEYLKRIRDFEVFPDDIWVVTFPKCGTTWTQEMVWLLVHNLDYTTAKSTSIVKRFPFIEFEAVLTNKEFKKSVPSTIERAANASRPRCIKSHLPLSLLPKQLWTVKPKIVYVSRDPKDAVISYYHHHRLFNGYIGSLEEFFDNFIADRVTYGPYWNHFLDFWKLRHEPHILFNSYEDMKKRLPDVIRKTATFLKKTISEQEVDELANHLSFESMKDNRSVNYRDMYEGLKKQYKIEDDRLHFMRQGETGAWKAVLSQEMIGKIEEWNKRHLTGKDIAEYPPTFLDNIHCAL